MFDSPELSAALGNLLLLVLTAVIAAIAGPIRNFVKTRLSSGQVEYLQEVSRIAVNAAEQAGLNKVATDKKNLAFAYVSEFLAKAGITLTPDQIDSAIEAAVLQQFNYGLSQHESYKKVMAADQAQDADTQPEQDEEEQPTETPGAAG